MRPYQLSDRFKKYLVPMGWGRPPVLRANRTAAGMSYTYARHRRQSKTDKDTVLSLVVYGTTATMPSVGMRFATMRSTKVCDCCGQRSHKLVLNDRGRLRLRALRIKREMRLAKSGEES